MKSKLFLVPLTFFLSLFLVSASEPTSSEVYLYSGLFMVILILLLCGYLLKSYLYHVFSGMLLVVAGVYTFINGAGYDKTWFLPTNQTLIVDGFSNWSSVGNGWIYYASFVLIALGLYYFVSIIYNHVWQEIPEE